MDIASFVTPGRVTDDYNVGREIGAGAFSSVREGHHKKTGEKVAIKMYIKKHPSCSPDMIAGECTHVSTVGRHDNIVEFKGLYETASTYDVVLEYTCGHELYDLVIQRAEARESSNDPRPYSEQEVASLFRQIVNAVGHCHANSIIHRDLCPDNFLASEDAANDPYAPIKLLNFKSATSCEAGSSELTVPYGYADYAAPEVQTKPYAGYGTPADMWSEFIDLSRASWPHRIHVQWRSSSTLPHASRHLRSGSDTLRSCVWVPTILWGLPVRNFRDGPDSTN